MSERRGGVRQKSFLSGRIYFNKRRGSLDCLIRDLSSDGARIIFSDTVNVPEVIELYIPQKEATVRARVKWRRGDEVGLSFDEAEATPAATGSSEGDLGQRVAQLEAEVASLRKILRRLQRDADGDVEAA